MVLEATVICLDNSEWMRNGDYNPTRMEAQHDAVSMICGSKIQSNPESTVSVMTMAGKCEMLVTLTSDLGKLLTSLANIKISGSLNILSSLQVAQLGLKHRQNKHQRQRIIVFVGSPLETDERELVKVGKKLKKNNVAVDVINFGEEETNTAKLEAFVNAVNSKEGNSHLVSVPPGPHILSDILVSSPILAGEGGVAGVGGADASQFEFGVDPSLDPELAMALRISMEEERLRQERARREAEEAQRASQPPGTAPAPGTGTEREQAGAGTQADTGAAPMEVDEEQKLLEQAIALSMQAGVAEPMALDSAGPVDVSELTEEQQIELAMRMSMMAGGDPTADGATGGDIDVTQNKEFLSSVLGSLPGVDPNDEAIRHLMGGLSDTKDKEEEEEKKKDEEKKE
eukprot:comp17688_c0_seq2/m.17549 comp17688_c0_seq2/g.17549  ORF comp17688_c0_seq2/g.17549 comp17688_c0_seq2/m.17549 type:complete len:400 (-) comp17688_c0_seq2:103-1302(-)